MAWWFLTRFLLEHVASHSSQSLLYEHPLLTFWCFVVFITLYLSDHIDLLFISLLIQGIVDRRRQNQQYSLLENNLKIGRFKSVTHMYFALPYGN